MIIYLLILVLSGITMTILGGLVYLRNPKSAMSRYFLLLCLSIVTWIVTNFIIYSSGTTSLSVILAAHIAPAAAFNILFWLLLFSACFGKKHPQKQTFVVAVAALWLPGTIFSASSLVFASLTREASIVSINSGVGYMPYLLLLVGMLAAALWQLIAAKKTSTSLERTQIDFILFGATITFGIAILNNGITPLLVPSWQGVRLTPLLALVLVSSITYAIVRHRLFDIRLVVARTVAYSLLVAILIVAYTLVVFAFSTLFFDGQFQSSQILIYACLAIFVSITFQPLKEILIKATDQIFYRAQYDSNQLLSRLTHLMASTLKLEDLTQKSLQELLRTMHISRGAFVVVKGDQLTPVATYGFDDRSGLQSQQLYRFAQVKKVLVYDEENDKDIKQILHKMKLTIVVPLLASDELQGLLLLGEKLSGDLYQDKDMRLLEILGPELAVTLDNARSYQQISEFNVTLEHEVKKATKDLQVANDKLSKNNQKLRQLDELKDEFISVTSHELRTPLTSIKGYLWMAMHGKKRDAKFVDYMSRAYVSTERLITMVNDTLDVSRIESGRVELSIEPTNLNRLAQDVVDDLQERAVQQNQQLTLKKTRALPLVDCDPTKIYQVLTNLVGNALKFTPPGGKIKVDFTHRGSQVIVRVLDNGPGISRTDQEKLFQKFSRLESSTSIPGTGLGLYLCLQIIKLSKGKIWIESQEGRGASFLFTLPVSKTQAATMAKHPQQFRNVA